MQPGYGWLVSEPARTRRVVTAAPAISIDARTAAERLLSDQLCGQPRCRCAVSARRGFGLTHCPLHEDHSPSFNITLKDQKLLVCCEAGCVQEEVVGLLREAGLWPQNAQYGKQIVAEYDYKDASGKLLYQSLRYMPKDFRQRKPKVGSGWEWSIGDVERVPYRLPELLSSGNRIVFIVEGEKDVDRLIAEGFVATCNVGGAGKWRDEYSVHLKGRSVVVVPDNDESGKQHGLSVARSLRGLAKSVRWLELPDLEPKGDVSDWFADGGTATQLRELALKAGQPPGESKRDQIFVTEGLGYRFDPAGVPITMRFSRLSDRREETTAELAISHAGGQHIVRRRVNLLSGQGTILKQIVDDLRSEELGIDIDWSKTLRDSFELVLDAHRNGLVFETAGGDIARPGPVPWLCDGLIQKNKLNCWLGAAGTGKSTLAKALCGYYTAGFGFLGRETERGRAIYLDWEDEKEDLDRVLHDVARSLGIWPAPEVTFVKMKGKRLRDHVEALARKIDREGIGLLVLDAIAAAGGAPSEHATYEAVALELEQCLGQLPPVTILGLDHITSSEHKEGHSVVPTKARGSERKVEFVRNQWTLVRDRDESDYGNHIVSWHHTKINNGKQRPPFTTEILHEDGKLIINERGLEASPAAVERLSSLKQYVLFVRANPGKTADQICMAVRGESTKNRVDSCRVELKRASRRDEVHVDEAGRWWPGPDPADNEGELSEDEMPWG